MNVLLVLVFAMAGVKADEAKAVPPPPPRPMGGKRMSTSDEEEAEAEEEAERRRAAAGSDDDSDAVPRVVRPFDFPFFFGRFAIGWN